MLSVSCTPRACVGAEVSRRKGGKRTHECADAYLQASAFEGISSAAADAASVQVRGLPAF